MDTRNIEADGSSDEEEEVHRPIELPPPPKLLLRPTPELVQDVIASEQKSFYLRSRRRSRRWWWVGLLVVCATYVFAHSRGQRLDLERKLKSPDAFARLFAVPEMSIWRAHLHTVQANVTSLVSRERDATHGAVDTSVSACDLFLDQLYEVCTLVDVRLHRHIASASFNQRIFDTLMVKGSLLHVDEQVTILRGRLSKCVDALEQMRLELSITQKILRQQRKAIPDQHLFPGWLSSRVEKQRQELARREAECDVLTDAISSSEKLEWRYNLMPPLVDKAQQSLRTWIHSMRLVPAARAREIYSGSGGWHDYFDRSLYRVCDQKEAEEIASFSLKPTV